MKNTTISWTDHTFNPWIGCTKISPACQHCYAETLMDNRLKKVEWGAGKPRVRTGEANWKEPLKWNREAVKSGTRPRVFCASLADWLDDEVPIEWLADLLALIHATPNLDWLLLTKRPENWGQRIEAARHYGHTTAFWDIALGSWLAGWTRHDSAYPPDNIWIGTTVENQKYADERIPELLKIPAKVRFLSCEPLLGPVQLSNVTNRADWLSRLGKRAMDGIHWIIAGGESGPHARPSHPDWFRSLREQCVAARVPFHFKQWGEWAPYITTPKGDLGGELRKGSVRDVRPRDSEEIRIRGCIYMKRVGNKAAGRLLDGVEHNGFPQ